MEGEMSVSLRKSSFLIYRIALYLDPEMSQFSIMKIDMLTPTSRTRTMKVGAPQAKMGRYLYSLGCNKVKLAIKSHDIPNFCEIYADSCTATHYTSLKLASLATDQDK